MRELFAIWREARRADVLNYGATAIQFERAIAATAGVAQAISTSSCSIALRLAWQSLCLKPGDEVIVPVNAFWNAVSFLYEQNITVRIADVRDESLTVDTRHVRNLVNGRTRAILSYSHGGYPSPIKELRAIADEGNLWLVEDSAHAFGALVDGVPVSKFADIACFSFSTLKNMGTLGEGGIAVTDNMELANRLRNLRASTPLGEFRETSRNYDTNLSLELFESLTKPTDAIWREWTDIHTIGLKSIMTNVQSAVGLVQLNRHQKFLQAREAIARGYDDLLKDLPGIKLQPKVSSHHRVYHLYAFFVNSGTSEDAAESLGVDRNGIYKALLDTGVWIPPNRFWPLNLNSVAIARGARESDCPVYARFWFREMVSLPITPTLTKDMIRRVERAIKSVRRS